MNTLSFIYYIYVLNIKDSLMRYLPQYEDNKSQQQQTAYDAADQNPERDGNSSSLQHLQYSLKTSVGDAWVC